MSITYHTEDVTGEYILKHLQEIWTTLRSIELLGLNHGISSDDLEPARVEIRALADKAKGFAPTK